MAKHNKCVEDLEIRTDHFEIAGFMYHVVDKTDLLFGDEFIKLTIAMDVRPHPEGSLVLPYDFPVSVTTS